MSILIDTISKKQKQRQPKEKTREIKLDAGIPYDLDKDLNRHEVFVFFDQVEEIKPAAHHKKKRNIIK